VADLVGLDHATLAADAQSASSTMPEPLVPGQEEEVYARPHQFQQVKPKASFNWVRAASIAGVAGVLSVYLLWRNGGVSAAKVPANPLPATSRLAVPEEQSPAAMQQALPPQTVASAPVVEPTTGKIEQTAPQASSAQGETATPPPPGTEQLMSPSQVSARSVVAQTVAANQPPPTPVTSQAVSQPSAAAENDSANIHIELSAIQPTWLSISADGKTTYSGTLAAMKTMTFDGKESAQIRMANAGGVNIIFNGRALGPLGRRGQSRTFVFTKSGYEVVQGVGNAMAHVVPTGGE